MHEDIVDILWRVHNDPAGGHEQALAGRQVDFATGQLLQTELLACWLAAGEHVGGWKIGMTSGANRNGMGDGIRPFGFVLNSRIRQSGTTLDLTELHNGQVENELCLIMDRPLGKGATATDARNAVAAVAPAFEINQKRLPADATTGVRVADDLSNWGIVVGKPVREFGDLSTMTVALSNALGEIETVSSVDHIDDHFISLAILANRLSEFGLALQAGHHVITGAYGKTPFAAGTYTGVFDCGIGSVSVNLA